MVVNFKRPKILQMTFLSCALGPAYNKFSCDMYTGSHLLSSVTISTHLQQLDSFVSKSLTAKLKSSVARSTLLEGTVSFASFSPF